MNYILVDAMNMFMRSRHVTRTGDIDMRIGMALHIMFNSINKAWRDFQGDHVVLCTEGRSWRKDVYPPYKQNRKVQAAKRSVREQQDDELFMEAYGELVKFFQERTNCTVAHCPVAEADDLIAVWIQEHPDDQHIIVSSDSDFYQLLDDNVIQYNGVTDQIISLTGWEDARTGKTIMEKKTGQPKPAPDPQYLLFEKCIRGDTSDNIFSAYPGVRTRGTKNKAGIQEAFQDKESQGYDYVNFMLQRWTDHEGVEHRVGEDYERNRQLIDLTAQPTEIREQVVDSIQEALGRDQVSNVGIHFMKFCGEWDLKRLGNQATEMARILNSRYQ